MRVSEISLKAALLAVVSKNRREKFASGNFLFFFFLQSFQARSIKEWSYRLKANDIVEHLLRGSYASLNSESSSSSFFNHFSHWTFDNDGKALLNFSVKITNL